MAGDKYSSCGETWQERRAKKLRKKKESMAQHGKWLIKVYKYADEKRVKK